MIRCGVKAGEAFMVKSNPQWIETRERVRRGEVGELRLIQGIFSYFNVDPANIRNIPELGGGGCGTLVVTGYHVQVYF